MTVKKDIRELSDAEIAEAVELIGEKPYRAKQSPRALALPSHKWYVTAFFV